MDGSLVAVANAQVPMWVACAEVGMDVHGATSKKVYCPFGEWSHADGGEEAAFRVYHDHGFCFACWQYYSPVSLCVAAWEADPEHAARALLAKIGFTPAAYTDQWDRVLKPPAVDREAVARALKTRCMREAIDWSERQYDPLVAEYLARCLGLLVQVTSEDDARQWLETCSAVMISVLRRSHDQARGGPSSSSPDLG